MKKIIIVFALITILLCSCVEDSVTDVAESVTPGGFENISFSTTTLLTEELTVTDNQTEMVTTIPVMTTVAETTEVPVTTTPMLTTVVETTTPIVTTIVETTPIITTTVVTTTAVTTTVHYHDYISANCTDPEICRGCGETRGTAYGHTFVNGGCSICGVKDPDYVPETMVWIPTNGGIKYHSKSGCSGMKNPEQVTKSEAISRGFGPCGRCY